MICLRRIRNLLQITEHNLIRGWKTFKAIWLQNCFVLVKVVGPEIAVKGRIISIHGQRLVALLLHNNARQNVQSGVKFLQN